MTDLTFDPLNDGKSKIEYVEHGNDDLTVVNAARTSLNRLSPELDEHDIRLINYLARAEPPHFTPFSQVQYCVVRWLPASKFAKWAISSQESQFDRVDLGLSSGGILFAERGSLYAYMNHHMMPPGDAPESVKHSINAFIEHKDKTPMRRPYEIDLTPFMQNETLMRDALKSFKPEIADAEVARLLTAQHRLHMPIVPVARQWTTHKIFMTRNEVSGRYVEYDEGAWVPTEWRLKPEGSVKQGSSNKTHEYGKALTGIVKAAHTRAQDLNQQLSGEGIANEISRAVLPLSTYTAFTETGSVNAYARLARQRLDEHAQKEIRLYAQALDTIMLQIFPTTWAALVPKSI